MDAVWNLLVGWCDAFILPGDTEERIYEVVEEQLREYDLQHSRHGYPALTDAQWEGYQEGLIEHYLACAT